MSRDSAAFAWIGLLVFVNAYWISYDLWAWHTKHKTMTGQMQAWLHDPIVGPLIFGLLIFIPAAFLYHIFVRASS